MAKKQIGFNFGAITEQTDLQPRKHEFDPKNPSQGGLATAVTDAQGNWRAVRGLTALQNRFLNAYFRTFGNSTKAAAMVGRTASTVSNWRRNNVVFRNEMELITDGFLDDAESVLRKKVAEGDLNAAIFTLKSKGKHRGYGEKLDINTKLTVSSDFKKMTDDRLQELIDNGADALPDSVEDIEFEDVDDE